MMDKELIERLALEAGIGTDRGLKSGERLVISGVTDNPAVNGEWTVTVTDELARFAALVAEECAKVASLYSIEKREIHPDVPWEAMSDSAKGAAHMTAQNIAAAIRAKFAP